MQFTWTAPECAWHSPISFGFSISYPNFSSSSLLEKKKTFTLSFIFLKEFLQFYQHI